MCCCTGHTTNTGWDPDRSGRWPTDTLVNLETCLRCQETTDGMHVTKQTSLKGLTLPFEVKNRQSYARKKTKAEWSGLEPWVFCESTWQASLHSSLSTRHCQSPRRCESHADFPSYWQALCTIFFFTIKKKVNQRKSKCTDIDYFQESAQSGTEPCCLGIAAPPRKHCLHRKHVYIYLCLIALNFNNKRNLWISLI